MEKDSKIILIVGSLIAIALIAGVIYSVQNNKIPGELDSFASCLKDKGATFYGAFWCPHCQAQKKLFGRSVSKLPYVECSLPSGSGQTQLCIDKKIESYPTWNFNQGIKVTAEAAPIVCSKAPGVAGENAACAGQASQFFKKWIFGGITVVSDTEPTKDGAIWSFDGSSSYTQGELSLATLATQTGCELPASTK